MILSIIVFVISLSLVIILHELGHFVMARRAGVLCHEFSLGMGPVIWKTKKGETTYSVRAIPIGGYVMMAGEEISNEVVKVGMDVKVVFENDIITKIVLDHSDERYQDNLTLTVEKVDLLGKDNQPLYINDYPVKRDAFYVFKKNELQIAPYERGFEGKTISQRFGSIFAGPLMNFILAFVVFVIVNLIVGFPILDNSKIESITEGLPAENVLEIGDVITSVNGTPVDSWFEMSEAFNDNQEDRTIELIIDRDGTEVSKEITPVLYFYSIGLHSSLEATEALVIGEVDPKSLAGAAGFKKGDTVLEIFDTDLNVFVPVSTWADFIDEVTRIGNLTYEKDYSVDFVVLRDNKEVTLTLKEPFSEAFLESQGVGIVDVKIGISPDYEFKFGDSFSAGIKNVWTSAGIIFTTIGLLFDNSGAGAGIGVDNLAGPLGIFEITSTALEQGFISLLSWIGLLSVNLGVINLLPIPALDGGRLVFLGYEAVTRRKPNKKIENTLHYVMYLALMGLFVFITYNDLLRMLNIK
jgi:regulator of sigma E protease